MSAQAPHTDTARALPPLLVEKVWGRGTLSAPFEAPEGTRIGEIWFEPPAEMDDLLVKYLFTSEKLSVQVHPSNEKAISGEAGKEECWLVLDAEPDATLAIGFDKEHTIQEVEAAARDGSIEEMLTWHKAAPGDVFYLPAGTVHAIGPGLALLEVQQTSDTTFRLYDYGRPRELHLERALAVAEPAPYPAHHHGTMAERGAALIDGPFFRLDRIEGAPGEDVRALYPDGVLVLPLEGEVALSRGEGSAGPGECLYASSLDALDFARAKVTILTRSKG